jgi:Bacteriophage related domain of unknown function
MPSLAVITSVHALIDAGWHRAPRRDLNVAGETLSPADGSAYLTVDTWISEEMPISIGSPGAVQRQEAGGFRVRLRVPAGTGIVTAATWLDELKALFRSATPTALKFLGFGSDAIVSDPVSGLYYEASFAVSYQYHFIG